MQYRILGSMEVEHEGRLLDLGRPKQRSLLALLLVHPNQAVSSDRLVEDLWQGEPPADAQGALQVQVSRLRRVLGTLPGGGRVLESRKPGYRLHVGASELDAARFQALVDEGRSAAAADHLDRAIEVLSGALALWRGRALAEFADEPFAMAEAARLDELRLAATEERAEAELARGRHAAVVGDLRQLAAAHPLREGLWALLILALYRCGRQAEALRAYGELRRCLGDELGIGPSSSLQRLEEAVLLQKPELDWAAPAAEGLDRGARARASVAAAPEELAIPRLVSDQRAPLVGRQEPFDELMAQWEHATVAGPRLALVAGEPGVGKTRLALELARRVQADGATVLVGRCDEDISLPFQPFAEALSRLVRSLPTDELVRSLGSRSGELVRLVPGLADLVDLAPPTSSDPETERYRLLEAITGTLAALSRRAPVLLLLDDLHWAAPPTLLALRHLVTRGEPMHLLAVGTYRHTELIEGGLVGGALAANGLPDLLGDAGRDRGTRVMLSGLDERAVGELVGAMAGRDLGSAGAGLARSIHASTAGNAFFVGEVVRHLLESGVLGAGSGPAPADWTEGTGVPEGVADLVRRRLARLDEPSQRLLAAASVIGAEYDLSVLIAAVGLDEETVLTGLEEAIFAGLVAEVPGPTLRQHFTHALVRSVLYHGLSSARRAQLHRRVGEAMEQVFTGRLSEHLPELAYHFVQAAQISGAVKAVRYSTEAGHQALAKLANEEAECQFRRALDLLAATPAAGDPGPRLDLLLALGDAERRSGSPSHRQTLREAADLAALIGDGPRLATAVLAGSRGFWSSSQRVDTERVATLELALTTLGDQGPRLRARLLADLGVELVYAGDAQAVRRISDEALETARRLGDPATLGYVLGPRYNTVRGDPATLPERLANTAELLAVSDELPDPSLRSYSWAWRAQALMEAGETDEARHCAEVFDRLADGLHQPTITWFSTYLAAGRTLLAGDFDQAERLATAAYRLGKSAGHADAELFLSCQQMQISYERGSVAHWDRRIRLALAQLPPPQPFLRSWQALVYCELVRDEDARRAFEELAAKDFTDLVFEPTWLHVVTNCAAVCAHLGDGARAAALLDLIAPYQDQVVSMCSLAYCGSVAHHLAMLLATVGRHQDAEAMFARALGVHERLSAPAWQARTQLEWARCILAGADHDRRHEAVDLLGRAATTAGRLGAASVGRRARALLDQVLVDGPATATRAEGPGGGGRAAGG